MGRLKGRMTANVRDMKYPHQISLPTSVCGGDDYHRIRLFADTLSVAASDHSYCHEDKWYRVYCFAGKADAEKFREKFGGEWFDPARRGRGKRWAQREPKKRHY